MTDPYYGREQTKAKHFILRRYLQALAFKVLTFSDITYVDGFSGPWETKTENFSDSSFMIAINVLQDAQKQLQARGVRRKIRCFLSENNKAAFEHLEKAVRPFHRPGENFEIRAYCGDFENAVDEIQSFVGTSFPLIFIDPTGWSGYPLDRIRPLFARPKCEVVINFMYEFINRFIYSGDNSIIASLDPILGGPGWYDRLDHSLPRGVAVEKLFRSTLGSVGGFNFVVSTRIDRSTAERPHFFLTYGTKSRDGLITFRQIEYEALREHAKSRAHAKERKREFQLGTSDLFAAHEADVQQASFDDLVREQKMAASQALLAMLSNNARLRFSQVVEALLQSFLLRETNVKDICVELASAGKIRSTWSPGRRKPNDNDLIELPTV